MPLVEVLPNSSGHAAPGWAYVPDTGYDPSKAALNPSGRKRTAGRYPTAARQGDISAREQTAITRHLAELDKDSHKDVQIPVPQRQRDASSRGARGKMTPGVRKIIQSQKTFANHVADEEAFLANQTSSVPATAMATPTALQRRESGRVAKPSTSKRKRASISNSTPLRTASPAQPFPSALPTQSSNPPDAEPMDSSAARSTVLPPTDPDASEPLLAVDVPRPPSPATMDRLISAPPLSYNAARVAPSTSTAPPQRFCEICGYWGRVKCMKCGARVCGLECKGTHEESRCLRFYA